MVSIKPQHFKRLIGVNQNQSFMKVVVELVERETSIVFEHVPLNEAEKLIELFAQYAEDQVSRVVVTFS
jgi:hypothetical protein